MTKDVMVGFPCYDGKAETDTMQTLMECLYNSDSPVGAIQYLHGDSLVTRARNKIVKKFLDSDMQFLMFIDSDILFDGKQIATLRKHDKFIVGGVYLKKKLPYAPVCNSQIGKEGELDIVREAGTGFLMIHREVFEDMKKRWPEHIYKNEGDEESGEYYDWFRVGVKDGRYLSEDYYFCHLATKVGYNIYYDSATLVRHVGRAIYPFKDEELLGGAKELLDMWNPQVPVPSIVQGLYESVQRRLPNKPDTDLIKQLVKEEYDRHNANNQLKASTPSAPIGADKASNSSGRRALQSPDKPKPNPVSIA